jgi:hypothetical protein
LGLLGDNMSNLPQQNTINQYLADGMETEYIYSYLILLDTDIQVYVTPPGQEANPANDIQELGTDYTVSGMGIVTGGLVTFVVAPVSGAIVTLSRNILVSIDTNFSLAQNFNGANLDAAFERITLFTQQTETILSTRALQYEVNTYLPNSSSNLVPPLANGQVWSGLNGSIVATTIETDPDVSLLRSQLLSEAPLAEGALLVGYYDTISVEGVLLGEYLDYKDVFGTDTGIADAMVLTIPNSNFKYANGQTVHAIVSNTNLTTTPTLEINGLGPVIIKRNPSSPAQASDLTAGTIIDLIYDSSANNFYIINLFIPTISSANPTIQILSGTGTYTPPAGATWAEVEGVGAGGGGGGVSTGGAGLAAAASGGSSGGYFYKLYNSLAASYPYSVGVGGAGGGAGATNGSNGGNTTFDTLTAGGGLGGLGGASFSVSGFRGGQAGGTASGGDINIVGDPGGGGFWSTSAMGGWGGQSQLGPKPIPVGGSAAGSNAANAGSGGGGASTTALTSNRAGGNGANGVIIVREYYS